MNKIKTIILSQNLLHLNLDYILTYFKTDFISLDEIISAIVPIQDKEYNFSKVASFFSELIKKYADILKINLTNADLKILVLYCLIRYFGLNVLDVYDNLIELFEEIEIEQCSNYIKDYKEACYSILHSTGILYDLYVPEQLKDFYSNN